MNNKRITKQRLLAFAKTQRFPVLGGFVVILVGAVTAMACMWSLYTDHSVRFNSFRSGRAFYRLPPLPIMYDSKTGKEISVQASNETGYAEEESLGNNDAALSAPLTANPSEIWEQARIAIQQENLSKAQPLLQKFLAMTAQPTIEEEADQQQRRNAASDMLDALTALQQGSKVKSVAAYLEARYAFDNETAQNAEELIRQAPADKNLQDRKSVV